MTSWRHAQSHVNQFWKLHCQIRFYKKYGTKSHIFDLKERPLAVVEYAQFGDLLGYLRKSRGMRDNYYSDPSIKPITSLTSKQLLKFAWEISDGMEYLSMKKVNQLNTFKRVGRFWKIIIKKQKHVKTKEIIFRPAFGDIITPLSRNLACVAGPGKNGRARACLPLARSLFLGPTTSKRLLRRLGAIKMWVQKKLKYFELAWMNTDRKRSEHRLNPFALSKAVLIIWYKTFL